MRGKVEMDRVKEKDKSEIRELKESFRKLDEEKERLKDVNDVQNKLWKVWITDYENRQEEVENGKNIEERKRGKGMEDMGKEKDVTVELNESEIECEEGIFEFRKNRGFRKGSEENREKVIQNGKSRYVR